ncbi:asparagine synthase-related protein [Risungbinella massiliensis]|uniref:asparagine synthase-related protein n=1 Tax=Risungbinella massiliensis TaxID=1329796 RepID=UPI0005CC5B29|nr:asparagine synthase-related protein [Risungbinella massiliensis]
MPVAFYSTKGEFDLSNQVYSTVVDGTFCFPSHWHSYQVNQYIIVVLEDLNGNIGLLLEILRSNSTMSDDLLQPLKGSFSFLLYDRQARRLQVFRSLTADPVFYYHYSGKLVVSNELDSLRKYSRDLNTDYFKLYLHTELTETEHTPYMGVKRILPAHKVVKEENREIVNKKYWSLTQENRDNNASLEEHIETFASMLKDAVKKSVADQRIISCEVSGGLDSTSVAFLAEENIGVKVYGHTYIFDKIEDGKPNKETVDIIYQQTDIVPNYLNLSNYWSFKHVKDEIKVYDEPSPLVLHSAMFHELNQSAKSMGSTVLLSGEGGDELLSSSSYYLRDLFLQGKMSQVWSHMLKVSTKRKQPLWKIFCTYILPSLLPLKLRYRLENELNKQTWQNTGFSLTWYTTPSWIGDNLKGISFQEVEEERRKIRDPSLKSIYLRENFERFILINPCPWLNSNIGKPNGLKRIYPFRDQRLIEFFLHCLR